MGTSASNNGPSKNTPLLPPWAMEIETPQNPVAPLNSEQGIEPVNGDSEIENESLLSVPLLSGDWQHARRTLTAYSKNPSTGKLKKAFKSYIRSSGGSRSISNTVIHGKKTAARLSLFFSSIGAIGVQETFSRFNIGDLKGLSAELAINRIVEILTPPGGTVEEEISKAALLETLKKMYNDMGLKDDDLQKLKNITSDYIKTLLGYFVNSYVYIRWLHELGIKLEGTSLSASRIVDIENQTKKFIHHQVKYAFTKLDFLKTTTLTSKIKNIMDEMFYTCFSFLEAL